MSSGDNIEAGRIARAEGRTVIWAETPPTSVAGAGGFSGDAIFIVEVARSPEDPDDYSQPNDDWRPIEPLHGIVVNGYNGHSDGGFSYYQVPATGNGVVARGGLYGGTGVVGLGGGRFDPDERYPGEGGIGLHGVGGMQQQTHSRDIPPGPGIVGQGGRRGQTTNRLREPHAAGVIGMAGSYGLGPDGSLVDTFPEATEELTGGVGVYGQGSHVEIEVVLHQPSGPVDAGPGVVGHGGVTHVGGFQGVGVMGLSGGTPRPKRARPFGVHAEGHFGLYAKGNAGRAGVFETSGAPHLNLGPLRGRDLSQVMGIPGDLIVTSEVDERGTEIASLWFCKSPDDWTKLA